ncbi:excinuclease ABC subunit UvrB [Candidatus Nanosyncoccus alces]|uniref:UvrABC system protein B n=1 Tax=Candidatus Nanosyncoccus alces TaxID=2171997 RepID=A0ABY0FL94_9BACT|nr:excinuclease ABC subunit UvrB [Candidatus Nanosyncoccus alces]RYC74534.1 UvrABC system protein B [Candidatus Nanosyncoccus alces]
MSRFKLVSKYRPTGDQPQAIEQLTNSILTGTKEQTLLGVTGSGKTFTMANVIQNVQKPTLILAHNKTLAAQLYSEFREFFPKNEVHYFVSYFDYYQPEAYIASTDTYIEKDSAINDEIDRLRHGATEALLTRRDVIVVSSVSCIYGIGSPMHYLEMSLPLWRGKDGWFMAEMPKDSSSGRVATSRRHGGGALLPALLGSEPPSEELSRISLNQLDFIRALVAMQYHRNDLAFERGNFRVMGDTIDLYPANGEYAYRFEFGFDALEEVKIVDPLTFDVYEKPNNIHIFPNTHYATPEDQLNKALVTIRAEFDERLKYFERHQKYLEAQRLSQRTKYDLEMLKETGFVKGVENYSRHLDGRQAGEPPATLLDFFPEDWLLIVDESHMTLPQVRGMYNGDHARKLNLVDYGFRLPSALDNRPLTYGEFQKHINQAIYVSATPGEYELEHSPKPAEQVIRPTGLLDPEIEVRGSDGQIGNLMEEIDQRIAKGQRTLITTLTKRMAEDLTDHLKERGIKTAYIHSDIDTLERGDILRDLRTGVYDVLVGINLLREGLDLPEVSLVAILDADKEGFLRSESALVQTIGRAARHEEGKVIMYANFITESMEKAISETNRRREIQKEYNSKHNITPHSVQKEVSAGLRAIIPEKEKENKLNIERIPKDELPALVKQLSSEMQLAAANLEFERAAFIRDEVEKIKDYINGKK